MAKVEWADAIKTVSGAMTKINKKSQHAGDQKMVLATHRKAATTSPDCSRIYLRGLSAVTRSTPVTADEQAQRVRFAAIARAVAARGKDMAQTARHHGVQRAERSAGWLEDPEGVSLEHLRYGVRPEQRLKAALVRE